MRKNKNADLIDSSVKGKGDVTFQVIAVVFLTILSLLALLPFLLSLQQPLLSSWHSRMCPPLKRYGQDRQALFAL